MKKIIYLLLSLFIISCGSSSPTVKKTRRTPSTSSVNKKKERKDRPRPKKVKKVDKKDYPPIENNHEGEDVSKNHDLNLKDSYNVKLMFPLGDNPDEQFVEYYAGMKLAIEEMKNENYSFNIDVIDTDRGNIKSILRKEVNKNTDLVLGPYDRNDLKEVVDHCKDKEVPVISQWISSTKLTKDNPYYIQLRPNLKERYYKIMQDIANEHRPEDVVIVGRASAREKRIFNYFQEIAGYTYGVENDTLIEEFIIDEDTLTSGLFAYRDLFEKEKKVFIFPQYSMSNDESFLYSCMRRLAVEKGEKDVIVYGMPILRDSEQISFDYYSSLNMHIVVSEHLDYDNPEVVDFRRRYYNRYGALATFDAIQGYDMMGYIALSLSRYGHNFQFHIEDKIYNGILTKIQLQKKYGEDDNRENFDDFDYFENKYLEIISFQDGKFKTKS